MAEFQTTNKLLKQAIAEAEQLRQVAVENAKLSLEESFPSQIKSMLGRKLRAEAEEGEEENDVEQDEAGEEEGEEAPEASAPAAPKEAPATTETAKELPFQDGESSGGEFADTSAVGTADNKEPSADSFDSADDDTSGEDAGESDTDWYEDWTESDFDLDEVIAELEQDIKSLDGGEEEEGEAELEAPVDGAEDTPDADEAYPNQDSVGTEPALQIPPKTSGIGTESSHEEEGGAAVTAADPNKYADPSLKMDGAPEAPAVAAPEAPMDAAPEAPVDGEEELDLEVLLRELEVEDEKRMQDSEKMASLEKELAEYRKAVGLLRGKLHEINLLNAKLLYTNKIFRKEGLSNGQKVAIVENFDRATTVREVKMVYTVLVETLTSAANSLKAPKSPKKVVTEGFASKVTPSTAPKSTPTEALVEQTLAKRFQQLAGILAD